MDPSSRLQPIGLITFFCTLILGVSLVALSSGSTTPSASASFYAAQAGKAIPQSTPTAPPGCVLDWSIVGSPNPGTGFRVLLAVSAIASDDVWAVGYYDTLPSGGQRLTLIEHWNGIEWEVVPSPNPASSNYLEGIDAISANDIWAVGYYVGTPGTQALIMHWDGASWTLVEGPTPSRDFRLSDVEAVSANDAWAVGYYQETSSPNGNCPLVLHWNGVQWSISLQYQDGFGGLRAIHAFSPDDVWVVGYSFESTTLLLHRTFIMHWDGITWEVVSSPNLDSRSSDLFDITGSSSTDLWAVGGFA